MNKQELVKYLDAEQIEKLEALETETNDLAPVVDAINDVLEENTTMSVNFQDAIKRLHDAFLLRTAK